MGGRRKTAVGLALLVLAALSVVALGAPAFLAKPAGAARVHVDVAGQSGRAVWEGNVTVAHATALSALEAASEAGGFTVHMTRYPGMGAYVDTIANETASGAEGWVYSVERAGSRTVPNVSAESYDLVDGDGVDWAWSADAR